MKTPLKFGEVLRKQGFVFSIKRSTDLSQRNVIVQEFTTTHDEHGDHYHLPISAPFTLTLKLKEGKYHVTLTTANKQQFREGNLPGVTEDSLNQALEIARNHKEFLYNAWSRLNIGESKGPGKNHTDHLARLKGTKAARRNGRPVPDTEEDPLTVYDRWHNDDGGRGR